MEAALNCDHSPYMMIGMGINNCAYYNGHKEVRNYQEPLVIILPMIMKFICQNLAGYPMVGTDQPIRCCEKALVSKLFPMLHVASQSQEAKLATFSTNFIAIFLDCSTTTTS
jgi:hypothetical protein